MRTRVKICGITRTIDIQSAVDAGADAIGFVFFPKSPRYVSSLDAKKLIHQLPAYVQAVGLFVNATAEEVASVVHEVPLDILQFHGDESPTTCQEIAAYCKRRWYKAIQVHPDLDIVDEIKKYQQAGASAILLDAWHPDLKGGTGHQFDWSLFPKLDIPLILAGGLNPQNVAEAIKMTRPFAVDVSGGVESAKGIKDQQRIERFMQGVQSGSAKC